MSRRIIGVDVGGTFTDVFSLDLESGAAGVAKVPTTRPDQSGGFLDGIRHEAPDLAAIATVVHGTTAGTNALLERKGAKTGVITTEGFRDVLEMRRRDRPRTWGLRGDFTPVVPRALRLEVPERVLADGTLERRSTSTPCVRRRRSCAPPAARPSSSSSSTPSPTPRTRPRRWPPCARPGPTPTSPPLPKSCPKSGSSSGSLPRR
jgi:hypothetical protein